jgi:hypothetical protein
VIRANPDEIFLRNYDIDRRSIFVGGLPVDVAEEAIRQQFELVGEILSIQLHKKPVASGE